MCRFSTPNKRVISNLKPYRVVFGYAYIGDLDCLWFLMCYLRSLAFLFSHKSARAAANQYFCTFQIRVVKAFQQGLDRREPSLTGPSAARLREISRQLKLQVEQEGSLSCAAD